MYFKIGKRYYPIHQLTNYIGFPSNGLFLIDEGYELVADNECINEFGIESVINMGVLVYSFNKIMDIKLGFERNVDLFLNLKESNFDLDESIEITSRDDFYELYAKKGTTYKKVAETFNSFSSKGLYLVKDGTNNDCKKVEVINKKVKTKIDKAVVKSIILDHIQNNPVSYFSLVRETAKQIIINQEIKTL